MPWLACALEEVPCDHAERNEYKTEREQAHCPGGNFLQVGVVRGERRDEHFCLPLEHCAGNEHECKRIDEGELQHAAHAAVEHGAEVVADDRLRSMYKAEERQEDDGDDAVQNAECRNGDIAARERVGRFQALVAVGG